MTKNLEASVPMFMANAADVASLNVKPFLSEEIQSKLGTRTPLVVPLKVKRISWSGFVYRTTEGKECCEGKVHLAAGIISLHLGKVRQCAVLRLELPRNGLQPQVLHGIIVPALSKRFPVETIIRKLLG